METSSRSLRNTYNWAQSRIRELTKEVKVKNNHFDFRCVEDATAICQEFDEWLEAIEGINYHSGYGCQVLFGTIWLRSGLWMTRGEYDGSEWWVICKRPPQPKK